MFFCSPTPVPVGIAPENRRGPQGEGGLKVWRSLAGSGGGQYKRNKPKFEAGVQIWSSQVHR